MLWHKRSEAGITMIELMITVVIIGVVAGMAVPRFQKAYERLQFKSGVQEINSLLRVARSTAISQKAPIGVHFDGQTMVVTMFKDKVNLASYDFVPGDSVIVVDTIQSDVAYLSTDLSGDALVFRPNGSAGFNGGGNITIMATSENVVGIGIINVLASTGRIANQMYVY